MIPKRAFFTWVGAEPLPWLRQLSLDSFRKQNPDWSVELIRLEPREDMLAAQVTDIARYEILTRMGGLYLDTDIVFLKPVPEEWLQADLLLTVDRGPLLDASEQLPGFTNLAMMGSATEGKFFQFAHATAIKRLESLEQEHVDFRKTDYQIFGVAILNRTLYTWDEQRIAESFGPMINLPLDAILPIRWNETHKLFNGTPLELPEETIGVHWYGGCPDAKLYQRNHTLETFHRRPCYLTEAIKRAIA